MKLTHDQQLLLTNYAYEQIQSSLGHESLAHALIEVSLLCLNLVLIDAGERKKPSDYDDKLQQCLEQAQHYFDLKKQ